jgi:hypothetical protein
VSALQGIARCEFHGGQLEEFKRLAAQAMEIVRNKDTGELIGEASAELKAMMASSGIGVFTPFLSL